MADTVDPNLAVFQNLMDAGCDAGLAEQILALRAQGNGKAQLHLLHTHRRSLLDKIHETQKYLDCLDYLLYQMRKGNIT